MSEITETQDYFLKRIADLETQLAAAHKELSEVRAIHRQLVNDIREIGEKLIEDTCG